MCQWRIAQALIAVFAAALLAGLPLSGARADVGLPPVSPSGSSLSPDEQIQTNVRMLSEQVDLTVEPYEHPSPSEWEDTPGYWMRVLVDASFVMRNLGETPEAFDAWFPLAANTRYPDMLLYETSRNPENIVQDFRAHVGGQPATTRQVTGPALNLPEGESPWATFPVEFPPGEDVLIRVRYTLYPGGRRPFGDIEYILQTGAGWRDSIGEATITVHLPDPVTPESVSLGSKDIFGDPLEPQPAGYVVEGNTITWHLKDLEPGAEDNIFLNVLEPQRYARLLQARRKVEQAGEAAPSKAAAAYLELARAARGAVLLIKNVTPNGGGQALAQQASDAYEQTLALDPEQPAVYSEYAGWLLSAGGWQQLEFEGTCPERACDLVQRGLEKFPQDADLLEMDQLFRDSASMHQTEVAYATQDASATGTQAAQETEAARPTSTPLPALATQTALAIAMRQTDQSQAAPPTKTPLPVTTSRPASATPSPAASPTVAPAPPAGGGSLCPGAGITLALVSLLVGAVRRKLIYK